MGQAQMLFYPFRGNGTIADIYSYEKRVNIAVPYFLSSVSAGFPSPADDYIESKLDLNELLVPHPSSTFFVRANGNSMIEAGILNNDLLVVDRAIQASDNNIIIAVVDGELTVKRLKREKGKIFLLAENPDYEPIEIKEDTQFEIWGVVTSIIHRP
jgi:DNA polymerase V